VTTREAAELFAYDAWANGRMFAAAAALPEEDLGTTFATCSASILGTLRLLVFAEWLWLRRWNGESPMDMPKGLLRGSLDDVRALFADIDEERRRFVAGLADSDLERVVSYRALSGDPLGKPLGELMRIWVNSSSQFRGQVASQMRQQGHDLPATDLRIYLGEAGTPD
jgi:uncharacterized damage-inducible protein DinB